MKSKFLSFFTALIAVFTFGTFVSAQGNAQNAAPTKQERKEGFGGHHRGGKGDGFLSSLNLTDAQKEQARTIFENQKTSTKALHDELRQIKSQNQNGALSTEQQSRVQELRSQMKAAHGKSQADLMTILTPEQKTQFEQKRGAMRENSGSGEGRGGKHHGRGEFGEGGRRGGMMRGAMSELNLTAEQQQKARAIFETGANNTKTLREELRQIESQKRSGATLTTEQETRNRELRSQLRASMQKTQEEFQTILTAQQRTQIEQKRSEMRQRKQEHRQMKQDKQNTPNN